MATVAYTIRSHYDPKDRERLEIETGQKPSGHTSGTNSTNLETLPVDSEEQWRKESSQIYKRPSLASSAPRFVPAKVADGDWNNFAAAPTAAAQLRGETQGDVAGWYRSLTSAGGSTSSSPTPRPPPDPIDRPTSVPASSSSSSAGSQPTRPKHSQGQTVPKAKKFDKNDWFLQNVITATTSSNASTPGSLTPTHIPFSIPASSEDASSIAAPVPLPSSLSDILKRDPPPTSKDPKFKPPVWVALGPGNKGFGMLRKGGWNEGETLGPYASRSKERNEEEVDVSALLGDSEAVTALVIDTGQRRSGKGKERVEGRVKVEYVEVPLSNRGKRKRGDTGGDDDITELRRVEFVDLTLDSDEEPEDVTAPRRESVNALGPAKNVEANAERLESDADKVEDGDSSDDEEDDEEDAEEQDLAAAYPDGHGGTALLTPISTILKTDRLGIGLKPKLASSAGTKGAYRVPLLKDTRRNQVRSSKGFRVTSTQGVMDEIRRQEQEAKREREIWGRGSKGKERKRRKEEADRKSLLAYMNS